LERPGLLRSVTMSRSRRVSSSESGRRADIMQAGCAAPGEYAAPSAELIVTAPLDPRRVLP
jgi:hypothetical protein